MKILYIHANPKPVEKSYSLRVAREFISQLKSNPQCEIQEIDVYKAPIPHIDGDVLSCWDLLSGGCSLEELSAEGRRKLQQIDELVQQFMEADCYVFATPMWNLSIPPMMKAYIDCVCIAGKTFKYTQHGPVGLLNNKKAIHIQARGGVYSQGPAQDFEFGDRYIKSILAFLGVTDCQSLIVEGMFQTPQQADSILEDAISKAKSMAQTFLNPPPSPQSQQSSMHLQ